MLVLGARYQFAQGALHVGFDGTLRKVEFEARQRGGPSLEVEDVQDGVGDAHAHDGVLPVRWSFAGIGVPVA